MIQRIPENILEDILSRIDIVEVISGYIPLKKAGRNFRACCPFHHEKTPSFMVSPDKQIYHCFGCGESGNAFRFLMRHERLEFPEAVEALAAKAGVILPEKQKLDTSTVNLYTQLYKINELTASFYQQILNSNEGEEARKYLVKRGINQAEAKLFKLGFAPDKWDAFIEYSREKKINLSLLEKAGLILPKDKGGFYDRFRNRIIFPIQDIKSRELGFGARVFLPTQNKDTAKYINSPETVIYTKGKNLYGLNLSKDAIRDNDYAVIVEGYFDFITPYSAGLKNIVASLGTALTVEQVSLLKRYTNNVVMVYDGDNAGQLATLRSLDIFVEEGMDVSVCVLPGGVDPDSFVSKNGIESFRQKIKAAQNLFDYKLTALKSQYNINKIEGKAKISQDMLLTINKFKNAVVKSEYIKKLTKELNVNQEALLEELAKFTFKKVYGAYNQVELKKSLNINPTEKLLIRLMLEETQLINHIREHIDPDDFQDERISKIVCVMFDLLSQGKNIEANKLVDHLEDKDSYQFICESVFNQELPLDNKEEVVEDCIRLIKSKRLIAQRQKLQEEIKIAEENKDEEKLNRLRIEFCNLYKKAGKE